MTKQDSPSAIKTVNPKWIRFYNGSKRILERKLNPFTDNLGARDIMRRHWHIAPKEKWNHAVVEYESGARQITSLIMSRRGEVRYQQLSNSNTYAGGNFNLDTSTNISGLIALKGSGIVNTDKIYNYNGATLTVEQSFTCTTINYGVMSSGAAGAGNRYGIVTVNAGVTITFLGGATNTANGIISNPTSADSSSLNCALNINGTASSRVVFTNSVGASNTSNRYCTYMPYGTITATSWDNNYTYLTPVYCNINTAYQNGYHAMNDATSTAQTQGITASAFVYVVSNNTINTKASFTKITLAAPVSAGHLGIVVAGQTGNYIASGGDVVISGGYGTPGASTTYYSVPIFFFRGAVTQYCGTSHISSSDVTPTVVVPATLAFTNPGIGGQLRFTISNAGSYNQNGNLDSIYIYNSSGNTLLATFPVALYNSLGYGIVPGLTDGVAYTLYAKASTDGYQFSAACANAAAQTPTHPARGGSVLTGFILAGEPDNGNN